MCGRFVQKSSAAEMAAMFRVPGPLPDVRKRYNAAPAQEIAVVRRCRESGENSLDLLTWGLIPGWANDTSCSSSTSTAAAETVHTAAAWSAAHPPTRSSRC